MATANKHVVTDANVHSLFDNVDNVIMSTVTALRTYSSDIARDIALMRAFQCDNPEYWASFCIVTANLSNGMELASSFNAAHVIVEMMRIDPDGTYTMAEIKSMVMDAVPGAAAYNASYENIALNWHRIATIKPEEMTYNNIRNRNGRGFRGMGAKTTSWALALWNHHSHVFTLDRHMLRGLCGFIGGGAVEVSDARYNAIAEMMLEIAAMLEVPPLMAQWALWNTYRDNKHADHSMAVPKWYRQHMAA